ncbi:transmembrane protein 107 [Lingula anatina]|uniref:Transmembrane protein 107 n=1 Tax=Lingula anatina TaxID=7574 RepID=A0A1S3HYH9_LINAN|nr:transmembrane protein 107 [Lingula anatina]XP_013391077.1 transmembrane protein 107 [Lingula anatina]|eukprot:XP_013391075.1 transmembrane protein 107 [Lingula anatina]
MAISGIVPARFLTLIAHLVITITIFWSRDENVKSCLPIQYSPDAYTAKDTELIVALSITMAFFALELVGFLSGFSMFMYTQGMISTAAHASAAVTLAYFLFDAWPCDNYWYVFGFCSAFPAVTELIVLIGVLWLGWGP